MGCKTMWRINILQFCGIASVRNVPCNIQKYVLQHQKPLLATWKKHRSISFAIWPHVSCNIHRETCKTIVLTSTYSFCNMFWPYEFFTLLRHLSLALLTILYKSFLCLTLGQLTELNRSGTSIICNTPPFIYHLTQVFSHPLAVALSPWHVICS